MAPLIVGWLNLLGLATGVLTAQISSLPAQQPECVPERWVTLVREHLVRYPGMEIPDLYKLLHQATMGSEHAVPSALMARDWLMRELDQLGEGPPEPLVDSLGTGGWLARIHLRPFQAVGGSPLRLVDAFVTTAAGSYGGRAAFSCALEVAQGMARRAELPWSARTVSSYVTTRAHEGYPAVHHSDSYVRRYRPAYRVVALELVPWLLGRE